MKIGVTAEGEDLSSLVAEDFGHAEYFLIVDYDTLDYTVIKNEFANSVGAGMKVADAIIGLGVDAVIVGGIGSHGYDKLKNAGIRVSFDEEGTVEEVLAAFKRREEHRRKFQ